MIVTLLPLFLAANITVDEGGWNYGPEVIYNARIDVTSQPLDPMENVVMIDMIMKLKCRPKSELIINCRFDNPRLMLTLLKPLGESITKNMEELGKHGLGDDPFELRFSRDGLEEIVVSSTIIPSKLDMIRALVGQLNFGTDLTEQSMNYFDVKNDSSAGSCKTSYLMWFNALDNVAFEEERTNPYELIVLAKSISGQIGQLQKTRHIDDCRYPVNYFFGSWKTPRVNPTIQMKLKSSISHMNITSSGFTAFTEIELLLDHHINSTIATLTERLTVSLDKIVPASGTLPMIRDPMIASIVPTRWLYSDDSKEMDANDFDTQFDS